MERAGAAREWQGACFVRAGKQFGVHARYFCGIDLVGEARFVRSGDLSGVHSAGASDFSGGGEEWRDAQRESR